MSTRAARSTTSVEGAPSSLAPSSGDPRGSGTALEPRVPGPNGKRVLRDVLRPKTGFVREVSADEIVPTGIFAAWWWPPALLELAAGIVSAVALVAGVVVTLIGVVGRFTDVNLVWQNEAGVLMLSVLAFIGAAIAYRRREFAAVNILDRRIGTRARRKLNSIRDAITLVLMALLTPICWDFAVSQAGVPDQFLQFSTFWMLVALPIGTALIGIFALERIVVRRRLPIVEAITAVIVVVVFNVLQSWLTAATQPTLTVTVMCVLALVLLVAGIPLPFAFAAGGIGFSYFSGTPLNFAASSLNDSISNFVLVAIPFFLLTGFLMSEGRLSDQLGRAIGMVMRRVPGGVLHTIVGSMFLFSGVSGSKAGDMAAVGSTAVGMAEQEKYPRDEAMAVLAAGAAMGDTIPPSIGLIVLASISTLSVGGLFLGGVLPAVATAIALMVLIAIRYRKRPPSTENLVKGFGPRARVILAALPFTVVPAIIIVGIVGGFATPSQASALAVVATLILLFATRRKLTGRAFFRVAVQSSVISGTVLFITASASLFARQLTLAQVPQDLATLSASGGLGGYWGFLFLSSAILIVMGMVMEGLPAVLVFAPILIPVALQLGINPLQYGIVITMAIGIGVNSPPIGIGMFIASQIGKVPIESVSRKMWPYVPMLYVGLLAVIIVPGLVTWLPSLFHVS